MFVANLLFLVRVNSVFSSYRDGEMHRQPNESGSRPFFSIPQKKSTAHSVKALLHRPGAWDGFALNTVPLYTDNRTCDISHRQ